MMEVETGYYPILLGTTLKNKLKGAEDKIQRGRWVNLNSENYDKKAKWVKVEAIGSIVDRSLGGRKHAIVTDELAIFSYYPNPELEMICFDLLPIRSPLFDMHKQPSKDDDLYGEKTSHITTPPLYKTIRNIRKSTLPTLAAAGLVTMMLFTGTTGAGRNP